MKQFKQLRNSFLVLAVLSTSHFCQAIQYTPGAQFNFMGYDGRSSFYAVCNSAVALDGTPTPSAQLRRFDFNYIAQNSNEESVYSYTFDAAQNVTLLAQPKAQINGATTKVGDATKALLVDNPFYGSASSINQFKVAAGSPIITYSKDPANASPAALANNKQICIVQNVGRSDPESTGAPDYVSLIVNTTPVNNANSVNPEPANITLFESRGDMVFAAVTTDADQRFDNDNYSGIAVLRNGATKNVTENGKTVSKPLVGLFPTNAITGEDAVDPITAQSLSNCAVKLNHLSVVGNATVHYVHAMHWDAVVKKLYVAVETSSTFPYTREHIGLLVGALDKNGVFTLKPAVTLGGDLLTANTIIGYSGSSQGGLCRVKTMKMPTSSALYAIVQKVQSGDPDTSLYAVPLVYSSTDNTLSNQGLAARINNYTTVVGSSGDMATATSLGALIGGGPVCDTHNKITDLSVYGDTVYVSVKAVDSYARAGLFYSQCIYGPSGVIVGWSAWKCLYGAATIEQVSVPATQTVNGRQVTVYSLVPEQRLSNDNVYGAWVNTQLGTYWYWTGNDLNAYSHSIKGAEWTNSPAEGSRAQVMNAALAGEPLSQVYDLGPTTPGFAVAASLAPSLCVGLGLQKVMIAQTGACNNHGYLVPVPASFPTENIVIRNDSALAEIAPLASLAVSQAANSGWMFVGGYNGLTVLSQDSDGSGWGSLHSNAGLKGSGDLQAYFGSGNVSFKKIVPANGDFVDVCKVVCDGNNVYVLDRNGLYKFSCAANKFKADLPDGLNGEWIWVADTSGPNNMIASDFVIIGNNICLGTINGFLWSPKDAINWQQLNRLSGNTFGAVSSFYVVQDSINPLCAHVYFLNSDGSDSCQICRAFVGHDSVSVDEVQSSSANDYLASLGRVRDYCVTNGTFAWHARSLDNGATDLFSFFTLGTSSYQMHALEQNIYLKNDLQNQYTIGGMTSDEAFGGYVLAGPWGVKIYG